MLYFPITRDDIISLPVQVDTINLVYDQNPSKVLLTLLSNSTLLGLDTPIHPSLLRRR